MPVTFSPASSRYPAVSCTKDPANGSRDFLQRACSRQVGRADEILQSSFPEHLGDAIPVGNGLVHTLRDAYNEHHAVVIRPDDVWIAILTQFSFYVNGNAEALRKQFVQHEGKKELTVYGLGTRYTVDFGHLAKEMTRLIDENVVDPTLRQWIMPDFSTTTDNDRIVSSVVMMATMKEYFSYAGYLWCGIPRVTLEGGKRDWEEILRRAEKLKEYGHLTVAWYHLLRLVLSRFANCFDRPNATESHIFWHNVAHSSAEGSGSTYMSGWITAFCAFDSDGRWIGNPFKNDPVAKQTDPTSVTSAEFTSIFLKAQHPSQDYLTLDGARYHRVDTADTPSGTAEVDVKLIDNGRVFKTMMVAGLVGMRVSNSGDKALSEKGEKDTLAPVAGWWIFTKGVQEEEDRVDPAIAL